MKELPLHPVSVVMTLRFVQPRTPEDIKHLIADLFENLAQVVAQREKAIIGHIKGLAKLGVEDWLKVSIISPQRPAQVESSLRQPLAALDLATSFMVYGLEPEELYPLVAETVDKADQIWSGLVQLQRPAHPPHHHHHGHHH